MRYRYILVADYPAPWREQVYELVHHCLGNSFHVAYCTRKEARRLWSFPLGKHPKTFFKTLSIRTKKSERFFSPGIVPFILKHRPRVLICFSLYPTVLLGLLLGRLIGSKLIVFADTWMGRDHSISRTQKAVRKIVYSFFGDAFLGASLQTLQMFRWYCPKVKEEQLFLSSLCADNDYFRDCLKGIPKEKKYDIVFSGRISAEKNPLFFAEVACGIKTRLGVCRALIIADGDPALKHALFQKLEEGGVDIDFPGFIEHAKLPFMYSQAKLLLLPTLGDCWGVVLNEAMICGLPVITTQWTAAAGELVIDGVNGYVLPLESSAWVGKIESLLQNDEQYLQFSKNAIVSAQEFSFQKAAQGIVDAIRSMESK